MDGEVRLTAVVHGYPRSGYAYDSCSVFRMGGSRWSLTITNYSHHPYETETGFSSPFGRTVAIVSESGELLIHGRWGQDQLPVRD